MSRVAYHLTNGAVSRALPDPLERALYQDHLIVHHFGDAWGYMPRQDDGLLLVEGTLIMSSCSTYWPLVNDFRIARTDGVNGSWVPQPRGSVPQYVGVRFAAPLRVTGFQFSSGVRETSVCPNATGPCAYPSTFVLEASNDESLWTPLLSVTDYRAMRVATASPFPGEQIGDYEADRIFLSDLMDVPNDAFFLAYRMRILAAVTDLFGNYNVSELIFHGQHS
ncbi:hypothetical protein ASZ90_000147 [hydrocarbon metagenome]|uniref:F5/8 type C domain-containing protein n=1 Tax=hydrocarbon metagenome TaxID=938273 RepID=A0A0W8GBC1_9ZZZZ